MSLNSGSIGVSAVNNGSFFAASDGSESLITLAQDVIIYYTSDGTEPLITITQNVRAVSDGTEPLITIAQNVVAPPTPSVATFFERNGWEATIYVGAQQIPASEIHGNIVITKIEDQANSMEFTVIPTRGVQALTLLEGQSVQCVLQTASGIQQVFQGYSETPTMDLIERKIKIFCTNDRSHLIEAVPPGVLIFAGIYSHDVFGEPASVVDEMDKRLSTGPYNICFDSYNNLIVTNAFAKASPDFTFTQSDIYRDNGKDILVNLSPRSKMINTVEINFSHQRHRLWHQDTAFRWAVDWTGVCDFLVNGYTMPLKSSILAAIQGAGWALNSPVTFTPFYQAGNYTCDGQAAGFATSQASYKTTSAVDSLTGNAVVDSNGQPVMQSVMTGYTDYYPLLTIGANWNASTQWVQNVVESYTISVTAPQSVNVFGSVVQTDTSSTTSNLNTNDWTSSNTGYLTVDADGLTSGGGSYINDTNNLAAKSASISCLLQKAKYTILKSHRNSAVIFNTFLKPSLELFHTASVAATTNEGSAVSAKGKIKRVVHTMDTGSGDANTLVELAISVATGSATDSPLLEPASPMLAPVSVLLNDIRLGNHWGQVPQPGWNGMIGNKQITEYVPGGGSNTYHTNYPVSFVVDTPIIPDSLTETITYESDSNYTVALINDTLSVTF